MATKAPVKRQSDSSAPPAKRSQARMPRMPEELKGGFPATPNGEPLCFGFNMKEGCASKRSAGAKCQR
eukprot:1527286-Amphidinium_carterae.1